MNKIGEWNSNNIDKQKGMVMSEECLFIANKWSAEGKNSVLVLGCGCGRHAVFFSQKGFKVTAVDFSKDAIEITKKNMKKNKMDFMCKVADMFYFPFANDAFDCVFSYHVFSYQDKEEIEKIIKEITRVLKPDGTVFITLGSKKNYNFLDDTFLQMSVLRTEWVEMGEENDLLKSLFHSYLIEQIWKKKECFLEKNGNEKERECYYVEATVKKNPTVLNYEKIIGSIVECTIDRPIGSVHPKYRELYYPINYGYVNGVIGGDGDAQDAYILGEDKAIHTFIGKVIAVYHRYNDNEDKWIVTSDDRQFSNEEILDQIAFQENFFDGILVR